jgi:predicted GIY-YIG superfamily endonuclease/phage anti-repressor protein
MYNENTKPVDICIDLEQIGKWIKVPKSKLLKTLRKSYQDGIDFTVEKATNPNKQNSFNNNYKKVLLTPDCFKLLCMQSASKNAHTIRRYFLETETLLLKYKEGVAREIEDRMHALEMNQKPRSYEPGKGFIYVFKASNSMNNIYKLGYSKNLSKRLSNHTSSHADDIEVAYVYETEDVEMVEACVKGLLKDRKYRKRKEVYQADLDMIKEFISGCSKLKLRFRTQKFTTSYLEGGYFVAIYKDKTGTKN